MSAKTPSSTSKQLTLSIHDLSYDGYGIAKSGKDIYFVAGALPGEQVLVRLKERRKKIWFCDLLEIHTASPDRIDPVCPHYEQCGGCDLQHLSYPKQVEFKQQRVARELERRGLPVAEWLPAITADPLRYRRRARVGVRYSKDKHQMYIGFREAKNIHLTDIDQCPVIVEHEALDWAAWRERLLTLDARARITHIEVLQSQERLVLVFRLLKQLSEQDKKQFQSWAETLNIDIYVRPDEGELVAINQVTPLTHQVMGHDLSIHPDYFIQVNKDVNELMVSQAISWLDPEPAAPIWDLFAGHGNFSVPLAVNNPVHAVEVSNEMVAALDAHSEDIIGQSETGELIACKANLVEPYRLSSLPKPDYILLDPPRAGAAECIDIILQQAPKRIVYVSCDPATLARDLIELAARDYSISKAGILDMFPHTHHVETMVLLERVKGSKAMQNMTKQTTKKQSTRGGLKRPQKSLKKRSRSSGDSSRGASRG